MVELQIINKILSTNSLQLVDKYNLDESYFPQYKEEFNFVVNHFKEYNQVPDKLTFLDKFKTFEIVEVTESDKYLVETINEERLYYLSVGVVNKVAELLQTNANDAVEYIQSQLPTLQTGNTTSQVTDIISNFNERYTVYKDKLTAEKPWTITTGFPELDDIFNGWAKGEELVVLFARTGQGKSWVLTTTLTHAWEIGCRVGYISPEMSPTKIGYRFDTLHKHFSNQNLVRGKEIDIKDYEDYGKDLTTRTNPFLVATPNDFQKRITVSKLRQFCINNKLDILGIDGITYLTDERYRKGDSKTISLTNLSEDLMSLSLELQIPILVVVQSNRSGVKGQEDEGTPELESIRDSDGISHNATKVISLKQAGGALEFGIKKNRDGATGGKLIYDWNIDKGEFTFISSDGTTPMNVRTRPTQTTERPPVRQKPTDITDVF